MASQGIVGAAGVIVLLSPRRPHHSYGGCKPVVDTMIKQLRSVPEELTLVLHADGAPMFSTSKAGAHLLPDHSSPAARFYRAFLGGFSFNPR